MDAPAAPPLADMDPDYENPGAEIKKRQKVMERDAKQSCVKKIVAILTEQFAQAVEAKEREALEIDRRLNDARDTIDSLRACIVAKYYSSPSAEPGCYSGGQQPLPRTIHPTVKHQLCGKKPIDADCSRHSAASQLESTPVEAVKVATLAAEASAASRLIAEQHQSTGDSRASSRSFVPPAVASNGKVTKRLIVGNISKYIPEDKRDDKDMATHKWMVYVRGPREQPDVSHFVKKVWFFLHPSYKPNDLVEVGQPPFHLTKRGWGEFPVRVQVHLNDARGGKVDIIHHLKLDRTYTGLQTLGAETHVDVEVDVAVKGAAEMLPQPSLPVMSANGPVAQKRLLPPTSCSDEQLSAAFGDVNEEPTSHVSPELHVTANGATSCERESTQTQDATRAVQSAAQKRLLPPTCCSDEQLSAAFGGVNEELTSSVSPELHGTANGATSCERESTQTQDATRAVQSAAQQQQQRYVSLLAATSKNSYPSVLAAPKTEATVHLARESDAVSAGALTMECNGLVREAANADHQDIPLANKCDGRPFSASPRMFIKCQDSFGRYYLVKSRSWNAANSLNGVMCPVDSVMAIGDNFPLTPSNVRSPVVKIQEDATSRSNGCVSSCSALSGCRVQSPGERLRLVVDALKATDLVSVDVLINCLVKHCPLILGERITYGCGPVTAASRDEAPYCAPSLEAFLSWPLGKRRASEWLRAREVRKLAAEVLEGGSSLALRGEHLWSTKRIFQWCRAHLYSPGDTAITSSTAASEAAAIPVPQAVVACTSSTTLLGDIDSEEADCVHIDVDGVDLTEESRPAKATGNSFSGSFSHDDDDCSVTAEHKFVRNLLARLGMHLSSAVVTRCSREISKESANGDVTDSQTTAATCEAALYGIMLAFGEDLLRHAASATKQRGSFEVTVSDVIAAIQTSELFDFLSDKYMGE